MSQSTREEPDFPSLPRLSGRGSTHTTVARVTALWESLVGKPRGKATDSCINPVFLPGAPRGQRSLAGYSPQGHKELDMTEVIQHTLKGNQEHCILIM